ncbi:MAG: cell division protein SepF [Candidatus Aenigmarchaeota archaeon]|nr:cell division protein SepF [Candidatus Aenigmarchaeota archaeon]
MGLITDLFKSLKREETLVELPAEEEEKPQVQVRVETLHDFVDVDRITRLVKEGNIVFLRTAQMQKHDLGEFRNSVEKLKRVSKQFGWDIVGLEEGYIIVTPSFARVERS